MTLGGGSESELSKRIKREQTKLRYDNLCESFDYKIFNEFVRVSKKINLFIWCSTNQVYEILKWFKENTECTYQILTWNKTNPIPAINNTWLPDIEYCLYFRERGVQLNNGYELKSKYYISPINKKDKDLYEHMTIKPLELVKRHLLHTTKPNDIVLDCFLGSGTTAAACKEIGRRYIGFEIDENFFKIAEDRLNGITQVDKKLKENGIMNIFDFI